MTKKASTGCYLSHERIGDDTVWISRRCDTDRIASLDEVIEVMEFIAARSLWEVGFVVDFLLLIEAPQNPVEKNDADQ
jgi:hypothetical protein